MNKVDLCGNIFFKRGVVIEYFHLTRNRSKSWIHTGLTRARCFRFLLFDFNRVLIFNYASIKLSEMSFYKFLIENAYIVKKYKRKEGNKIILISKNVIEFESHILMGKEKHC